eukprot:TRINITY_DN11085_c0_g1_i3.p1 TRINITY_DN11085_c0_g1~~TRINITY_DN11085_c0_g1_i3.p1  ORF type:complete len:140 (-),score=26.12 TRINITY_DN11085_c0_g1_i3:309-686(-)
MAQKFTLAVIKALHLKRGDLPPFKSDPYVKVFWEGKESTSYCSPVVSNNLNPVWNWTQELTYTSDDQVLVLQVWDKDTLKADDFLGEVRITVKDLKQTPHNDHLLRCRNENDEEISGGIFIDCKF